MQAAGQGKEANGSNDQARPWEQHRAVGHQMSQQNTGKGQQDNNHDEEDKDNHDEDGRWC